MNVRTNSYFQAPPVKKDFPLIIFSHGLGGTKIQNSINIQRKKIGNHKKLLYSMLGIISDSFADHF